MEKAWIEIFAGASLTSKGWEHPDPEAVENFQKLQFQDMILRLKEIAEAFAAELRDISRGRRSFRVVSANESIFGFIFMLERLQTKIELTPQGVATNLLILDGFTPKSIMRHTLTPRPDAFGGLTWTLDQTGFISPEQLIKILAEEMLKAAFERGEIRP